ncbi:MAG: hypothetical protein VX988_01850 [Planctomycetota bacterium]|nr:hypothetical protein [Planctomycetota bacterium]MEE3219176.1 hypothetical protein [Planctomycetota bacterium]
MLRFVPLSVALVAIIGCGEGKTKTPDAAAGDSPTAAASTVALTFDGGTLK